MIRRLSLAMCLLLLVPSALRAAAPEGVWVYDRVALEAQGDKFGELMAKRMPIDVARTRAEADKIDQEAASIAATEAERAKNLRARAAQMRRVADDPKGYFKRQFVRGIAGEADNTLRLAAGGKAVSVSDGQSETGSWKIEGKEVVVTFKDTAVRGVFGPKRLNLRYAKMPAADADTAAFLKGFTWVMIPR